MKSGRWGFFCAILICLPLFITRSFGDSLLTDSDTRFLLMKLGEYNNPWRWFVHDWPLENHFYRPISTLFFELDWRLHPASAPGFGLTNALLCIGSALALFWLAWELFRSLPIALVVQVLFISWVGGLWVSWLPWVPYFFVAGIAISILRHRGFRRPQLVAIFGAFFLPTVLSPVSSRLSADTMHWIPGRTATSMALFCFIAAAAYVRFERQGAPHLAPAAPSSIDVPATRTTRVQKQQSGGWGWFVLSLASAGLAMGAYEQAVMIPFIMFLLGCWLRTERIQTRFSFQLGFWLLLFGYIAVRLSVIPIQPSRYQSQQFRSGMGWLIDLLNYVLPGANELLPLWGALSLGALILITSTVWSQLGFIGSNVSFWIAQRREIYRSLILVGAASLAFLPMAFLSQFGHYHFWPAGFMACFAVHAVRNFLREWVTAVSPLTLQAPPRSNRAPGSLPRL